MNYKVLITTSGTGTRMGDLTKYTNKSLLKLGDKPILSYIIESYPKDVEFVVTLGYFGNHVKEFLQIAYPKRKFCFVPVDKYQGEGSSLVYSIIQAKKFLQTPFIFHASDTIVSESIPLPDHNWCGGASSKGSSLYRSFNCSSNGRIIEFFDKGTIDPDYLAVGIVGIKDFKEYFDSIEKVYLLNQMDTNLSDIQVLSEMIIQKKIPFTVNIFNHWHDTGSVDSYLSAQEHFPQHQIVLNKMEESIFFFKKHVIKFFSNSQTVQNRLKRAKHLKKLIPKIESSSTNFIKYKYVNGEILSKEVDPPTIIKLLKWSEENLWIHSKKEIKNFSEYCNQFYFKKTYDRLEAFYKSHQIKDTPNTINGEKIPKLSVILRLIDKQRLCNSTPTNFHGDFILDNILKTDSGFCLLDWRQDFAGQTIVGDRYYDLAKLNHNLTLNHQLLHDHHYSIKISQKNITFELLRRQQLIDCQSKLYRYLKTQHYDLLKIKLLTAVIWLNMSPLHEHPLDLFLYYFGKYNLWQAIIESKYEE